MNKNNSSKYLTDTKNLIDFISECPDCFHTANAICKKLRENGYTELFETKDNNIKRGGKYFIVRNMSSVIAFRIPNSDPSGLMICAAHGDAPSFKLKPISESQNGVYCTLNTEKYGGMIYSTWLDRPLSISGRVVVSDNDGVKIKLFNTGRDFCLIPNLAIHMNSETNSGFKFNPQTDLQPICGSAASNGRLIDEIADKLSVKPTDIIDYDLFLSNNERGVIWGADNEFFSAPRIDDLQCAYAATTAFINSADTTAVPVLAVFDNEEVGSSTKQGAGSTFLRDTLIRIVHSLNGSDIDYARLTASSFMLSADNGHAIHPNRPEKADPKNYPILNGGVVIKYNANQRYTTDSISAAIFKRILDKNSIPHQVYTNRSDIPGGSTLGSISNTRVSLNTIDIGAAQLAMHSCFETGGTNDTTHLISAMREFFGTVLKYGDNRISMS